MHKLLFNEKRRSEGTSSVLLQSLPGGGKSHLARQYLYLHIDKFPGGIFWVRAKSLPEIAAGYWEIARKIALPAIEGDKSPPKEAAQFVSVVVDWLNSNDEWLLVLDGIHFDHSEDFQQYIPDNPNTSLIYTSTEKSVGGDHHFMNPQLLQLPLLSPREAQELFLLEIDAKQPTIEDRRIAMDLVQRMGFLPLVIHAAARRLRATEEPLARFARHFNAGPKLRDLDTYKEAIHQLELREAHEALNLMSILCFFSQHVPVEMMALGLKAVDVPIKAVEPVSGESLDNTFAILNRFALIERTDGKDITSSQTSKSSQGLPDIVDIIRMHSVVQDFFIDFRRADGTLSLWLNRAVAMFTRSFEHARERIEKKSDTGLVGDFRQYEIHAIKIAEHLSRNERRFPALSNARGGLDSCLTEIRIEISRRTRESSVDLAHGRPDAFQSSIFDRTSSSSDSGPQTPGLEKHSSWDSDRLQESPKSLQRLGNTLACPQGGKGQPLHSIPVRSIDDPGYDSEHENVTTKTHDDGLWDSVRPRWAKPFSLNIQRTISSMRRSKRRDIIGPWRSLNPIIPSGPRISLESASGMVDKPATMRAQSRGREMSGKSQAEVLLGQISKTSPPPRRGGGAIQDRRRSSQRPARLSDGYRATGQYASVVQAEVVDATISPIRDQSNCRPQPTQLPATPALQSLQHAVLSRKTYTDQNNPSTPVPYYTRPYPSSDSLIYDASDHAAQQANHPDSTVRYSANEEYIPQTYPRQMGPLPIVYSGYQYPPYGFDNPLQKQNHLAIAQTADGSEHSHPQSLPDERQQSNSSKSVYYANPRPGIRGYYSQPMIPGRSMTSQGAAAALNRSCSPPAPSSTRSPMPNVFDTPWNRRDVRRRSPRIGYLSSAFVERADAWDGIDAIPSHESRSGNVLNPLRGVQLNPLAESFDQENQWVRSRSVDDIFERGIEYGGSQSSPIPQASRFPVGDENASGEEMIRTGSGGIRVGNSFIAFGDFPEMVDVQAARRRVEDARLSKGSD